MANFPTTSFIPRITLLNALNGTTAIDLDSDTFKCALYGDTFTTGPSVDDAANTYGSGNWSGAEVTGTNWASGGVTATTPTAAAVTSGMKWDADDVSVSNTTISTAVKGCLLYDTTHSSVGIAAVYFGSSSGYTTNSGTFGITWDSSGIFVITTLSA